MLKDGADIYDPVSMSHAAALSAITIVVVAVASVYLYRYLLKQLALRKQSALLQKRLPDQANLIDTAIAQLQVVVEQVHKTEITIDHGAHVASFILRDTFDRVMNHRTTYQSRAEVLQRNLSGVAGTLDRAYPLEFDLKTTRISSPAHFQEVVNVATEVLQACR